MTCSRIACLCALTTWLVGCGPKEPAEAETTTATTTGSEAVPGTVGVTCTSHSPGHDDYTTSTLATRLDVCSVGGDGMLTLAVKGEGANGVSVHLEGYHGAGTYPLTGGSGVTFSNSIASSGTSQTSQGCAGSSACTATVTDTSTDAPAGAPHALEFAVSCNQLCDQDIWDCAATPSDGGSVTWTFRGDCSVR